MTETRLHALSRLGQSPWLDNLSRGLLTSGDLGRLVSQGIVGVTDNPTIFQQALAGAGDAYDDPIRRAAQGGASTDEIYDRLIVDDVVAACDLLAPVHAATGGGDGHVSLEVAPALAQDTQATVAAARRYWEAVDRPNLLIKIPATPAGIPAIEAAIAAGISVNVTLIFAVARYREVMEAYCRGLERRLARGEDVARLRSVASFFVSRVDTEVDRRLEALAAADPEHREAALALRGQAAISNARIAYQAFLEVMRGPRFRRLAEAGAHVQRPLWASTSSKNPAYRDVMYVEALIGPDTVDTMPPETVSAFLDHGVVRVSVTDEPEHAAAVVERLAALGIAMDEVTQVLEQEGVAKFSRSMDELLEALEARRAALAPSAPGSGAGVDPVAAAAAELGRRQASARLAAQDPSLWSDDAEVRAAIAGRLGWLDEPDRQLADELERLQGLQAFVQEHRFTDAVLVGMGGSSLCPDVLRRTFGTRTGFPALTVLDSTDPDQVEAVASTVDLRRTLLIVSSKSGTTTETLTHLDFFHPRLVAAVGASAGSHCIAVTDPGTELERRARELGFHQVVAANPAIGGRYSACSAFGMVPAAVMGLDLERLLRGASRMAAACRRATGGPTPGAELAARLAGEASRGRDKVTIIADWPIASLGSWIEQLLAESTGKRGRGLVPVAGEPLGEPAAYGPDRLIIHLRLVSEPPEAEPAAALAALAAAGQPVVTIDVASPDELGAEFVRWEVATALAGALLAIDPFDQPNVQESKDNTARLLERVVAGHRLPEPPSEPVDGELRVTGAVPGETLAEAVGRWLEGVAPPWYIAVMAYAPMNPEVEAALQAVRLGLRAATGCAVTLGYGPRFLHSTGQLHKGGPATAAFLQVITHHRAQLAIPGRPYDFGTLQAAQALGDFTALRDRGRRILRVHTDDATVGLRRLAGAIPAIETARR